VPASPVTAWFPVLLHVAGGSGSFHAAPIMAADILLRAAALSVGGRGSEGRPFDGDDAVLRLLQQDCR
jgi:hypothetical protein